MSTKVMPAELLALKSKMLTTSFYAMFRTPKDPTKMQSAWLAHVQWLIGLEKRDLLFASGPLFDRDGTQEPGLTIFRVATFADAETLAAEDPFVVNGAVGFQIRSWPFGIGRINVSLDFSDQTYHFR
jgi:uncharacterized protein YciI